MFRARSVFDPVSGSGLGWRQATLEGFEALVYFLNEVIELIETLHNRGEVSSLF